tara:strand:+ start:798 stop:1106 length:309 start_codon:yes stop_codon:yes gene_type:complete
MIQLKLPFDQSPDTGVYAYEVYTYLDKENKTGYDGHIRFVAARNIEEARHRTAYDFPRFWLWCGVKPVDTEHLKKNVEIFERQFSHADEALREVLEGTTSFP